jgi:hypothetical protein
VADDVVLVGNLVLQSREVSRLLPGPVLGLLETLSTA